MFDVPSFRMTVSIFFILYGVYMFGFILYSLFNVYHLVRYGFSGYSLFLLVTVFSAGAILLVTVSVLQMMQYDWSHPINVSNAIQYYNESVFPTYDQP